MRLVWGESKLFIQRRRRCYWRSISPYLDGTEAAGAAAGEAAGEAAGAAAGAVDESAAGGAVETAAAVLDVGSDGSFDTTAVITAAAPPLPPPQPSTSASGTNVLAASSGTTFSAGLRSEAEKLVAHPEEVAPPPA
jgi:hypothetical protein